MVTQPDVHAEALAQRALEQGADLVVASGGDGTIAAVAGVLRGSGVPLGIVPRGTANGFSVALGIPTHLDDGDEFAERACDVITDGHVALVDMALVTTSEATDVPCILLTGVGFEAEVVEGADRSMKDMLGITVDGEVHEGEIGALTIANSAPPTSVLAHGHVGDCIPDDGLLEVVGYVASDSTLENFMGMTRLAVRVMMGDGDGDGSAPVQDEERVFGGRAKEIIVETDPPQKVVVDGELLGTTPLTARVQPASLQVYVPRLDPEVAEALGSEEEEGGPIKGAASAAAASAPRATTGVGMEASAAVEASFQALDRQKQEQE
ncbi:methylglyoxal synthase [Monoraphidium neglectum]|uniref:Methylglyoxal synthase n=1 Tax=Monoraphidium neglectum TaxID=145388 RepID=A0A0D2M8V8_9CHLO|nr:methylglyoxal synthase [Monoraphidium neglectum]KIY99679.1 methylglyoxal synthase [Monoraphidium neglectum]|eukprot:XP_013898699.1 methylglyoxal synthase [Monoraphidium neglectum]